MTILKSDKTHVKTKTVIKAKGHYIMIKGSINMEGIIIITIYAPTSQHLNI